MPTPCGLRRTVTARPQGDSGAALSLPRLKTAGVDHHFFPRGQRVLAAARRSVTLGESTSRAKTALEVHTAAKRILAGVVAATLLEGIQGAKNRPQCRFIDEPIRFEPPVARCPGQRSRWTRSMALWGPMASATWRGHIPECNPPCQPTAP